MTAGPGLPALLGAACLALGAIIVVGLVLVPNRAVARDRRRYGVEQESSLLGRAATAATGQIGKVMERRGARQRWAGALDLAGIRMDVADFVLLVGAGALAAYTMGLLIQGQILAVMLGVFVIGGSFVWVKMRVGKRRSTFADQMDDMVQLLASNMRAGHSLAQALDHVARELEEPATSELTRAVNQARVGRDLGSALDETGERMDSDDFRWIAQAIAIHRQVGGNLAEVLDTVGETIRERGQIRRQVKALAAEGKLSAIILMALPFVVAGALLVMNPTYILQLTQSALGFVLIGVGLVLLTIGGLWLRKAIEVKF